MEGHEVIKNIYQHWKTTAASAGLAGLHVLVNGVNWKQLLLAAAVAALGAISKDPNSKS